MREKFVENPFYLDKLVVHSIYRSLSRHAFFITFKHDGLISKGITINTIGNDFALAVATSKTVWKPTFEDMKSLLLNAVEFEEKLSENERMQKL